jgi:methylmalonyl-CoA/ethylmalonyl-CoA epimerase
VKRDRAEGGAVDHVGVAVLDLEAALTLYAEVLAMPITGREVVESEGCEVAFVGSSPSQVELLRPLSPDTAVGRHLARRGPGLHHLAIRVADIDACVATARARGLEVLGGGVRPGAGGARVAVLHPRAGGGVLIELTTGREGRV